MAIYSDPEALKQRQEDMRKRIEARKEQAQARAENKRLTVRRIRGAKKHRST